MRRSARTARPANIRFPPALIIDQYLLTSCVRFATAMKRGAGPRATRVARGHMASEPAHDEETSSGKKNEEHHQPHEIKRGNVGRNDRRWSADKDRVGTEACTAGKCVRGRDGEVRRAARG